MLQVSSNHFTTAAPIITKKNAPTAAPTTFTTLWFERNQKKNVFIIDSYNNKKIYWFCKCKNKVD